MNNPQCAKILLESDDWSELPVKYLEKAFCYLEKVYRNVTEGDYKTRAKRKYEEKEKEKRRKNKEEKRKRRVEALISLQKEHPEYADNKTALARLMTALNLQGEKRAFTQRIVGEILKYPEYLLKTGKAEPVVEPEKVDTEPEKLPGLILNDEQINAKRYLEACIRGDVKEMLFEGAAGTGKTTVLKHLIESFEDKRIVFASKSHSIKNMLKESLPLNASVRTITSLLGKYPDKDGNFVSQGGYNMLNDVDLLIVDECSLIDDNERVEILNSLPEHGQVIWVGDRYQLPPVENGNKISSVFDVKYYCVLTKSNRFSKDSGIGVVSDFLRAAIHYNRSGVGEDVYETVKDMINMDPEDGTVEYRYSYETFKAEMEKHKDDDSVINIAYTNKGVQALSNMMWDIKNPDGHFKPGEKYIANAPFRDILKNGDIFTIENIEPDKMEFTVSGIPMELPVYKMTCHYKGREFTIYSFLKEHYTTAAYIRQQLVNNRKAPGNDHELKRFDESFLAFSSIYSITSHKAQGKTYDYVFVDMEDIFSVPEETDLASKLSSLYVAVTRARKKVVILIPEEISNYIDRYAA